MVVYVVHTIDIENGGFLRISAIVLLRSATSN